MEEAVLCVLLVSPPCTLVLKSRSLGRAHGHISTEQTRLCSVYTSGPVSRTSQKPGTSRTSPGKANQDRCVCAAGQQMETIECADPPRFSANNKWLRRDELNAATSEGTHELLLDLQPVDEQQ